MTRYQRYGKRVFDLLLAVPAAVVLLPVIGALGLLVRLFLGKPALFRQQRAGQNGRIFVLHKFRTMLDTLDAEGHLLPDEQRLTPFGRWLRRLSLDELPQLWNVTRGDMSLIGPRPLLVEYLDRYTPEQARRHEVPPGITGWAQVNGRNAVSWEQKFELDVWYVDHVSLWLDLKIFGLTFRKVCSPSDTSAAGHATMPKFMGTKSS